MASLVAVLSGIETGRPSRAALASGHYANVLRLDETRGLALSCDGVGTKIIVAEQLGRLDTVGIDCIAMNVNDVICVGADPIAVLDYIAVEQADPAALEQLAIGLRAGAEQAGVEIPGGELAVMPELIRGHPSPRGFDLLGFCVGLVELDRVVTGAAIEPGDAVIGIPSSGLHSNGYTLARRALPDLDERVGRADGRRAAARTDRDLRACGPGAARLRRRGARARAHHGRGLPEPAAAGGAGGLPDRRSAATAGGDRADRRALRGRRRGAVRGLQHGLRLLLRRTGRRRRRRRRPAWAPPPRHGRHRRDHDDGRRGRAAGHRPGRAAAARASRRQRPSPPPCRISSGDLGLRPDLGWAGLGEDAPPFLPLVASRRSQRVSRGSDSEVVRRSPAYGRSTQDDQALPA